MKNRIFFFFLTEALFYRTLGPYIGNYDEYQNSKHTKCTDTVSVVVMIVKMA